MKFRINTQALKKGVDIVSHATSSGNMTPILENILFQAQFQKLLLTANNLEMAIVYTIDSQERETDLDIRAEGSFTISSKFLTSFLPLVQETSLEVELLENGTLEFRTLGSETKIKGIESSKFPVIPPIKDENIQTLPANELKKAIEKTLFSTAEGNIRPTLAGINIQLESGKIVFASTDSYRLSEFVLPVSGIEEQPSIILPAKAAMELSRILPDSGKVELVIGENQIRIHCENIQLSSRLLNGFFPNYKSLFPNAYNTKGVVLRNDLIVALKRNNIIAREDNYTTRITFSAGTGIEITTGAEIGAGTIRLAASVEGQDMTIGLKSTYLLDVLGVIKDDYVSLEFERSISPVVVRGIPEGAKKESFRHMIMPLKI